MNVCQEKPTKGVERALQCHHHRISTPTSRIPSQQAETGSSHHHHHHPPSSSPPTLLPTSITTTVNTTSLQPGASHQSSESPNNPNPPHLPTLPTPSHPNKDKVVVGKKEMVASARHTIFIIHCHHNPHSSLLLKSHLKRLRKSLLVPNPNPHPLPLLTPILALLPPLLNSSDAKIVATTAEVIRLASLASIEMNELIAMDDGILKGLIQVEKPLGGVWIQRKRSTVNAGRRCVILN